MKVTLTSLDKDKFHILGLPDLEAKVFERYSYGVQEIVRQVCPELQLIIVPFTIESIASRPLTEAELRGFQDSIERIVESANTQPNNTSGN